MKFYTMEHRAEILIGQRRLRDNNDGGWWSRNSLRLLNHATTYLQQTACLGYFPFFVTLNKFSKTQTIFKIFINKQKMKIVARQLFPFPSQSSTTFALPRYRECYAQAPKNLQTSRPKKQEYYSIICKKRLLNYTVWRGCFV